MQQQFPQARRRLPVRHPSQKLSLDRPSPRPAAAADRRGSYHAAARSANPVTAAAAVNGGKSPLSSGDDRATAPVSSPFLYRPSSAPMPHTLADLPLDFRPRKTATIGVFILLIVLELLFATMFELQAKWPLAAFFTATSPA